MALLKQGVTPHKLALTLALGTVLGNFPVFGMTTFLCTAVAFALKLNLPAIHLVNYLMYPIQLSLVIPFVQIGSWIIGSKEPTITLAEVQSILDKDWTTAAALLWKIIVQAIIGWLVVAPFMTFVFYFGSKPLLEKLINKPLS
ncbi:MAG: hypothetical protein OHK0038_22660 [Flammeovirgaceae bacterium]